MIHLGDLCEAIGRTTGAGPAVSAMGIVTEGPDAAGEWTVTLVGDPQGSDVGLRFEPPDFEGASAACAVSLDLRRTLRVGSDRLRPLGLRLRSAPWQALRRQWVLLAAQDYAREVHAGHGPQNAGQQQEGPPFEAGTTPVPYAGRVFGPEEVSAAVGAALDFWLTLGPEGKAFEREFARRLGVRHSVLTNSGSSANLLAVAALTSPKLGERSLRPGDEVITCAAGFPTTVAPIVQCGAVPVFIDNDPATLNARVEQLEDALRPGRTRAVLLAHSLGNPFDLGTVTTFCRRHGLWLIEDNCDALGSRYGGVPTGTFGDLSTQSFYPPHHLTLGEGGMVNVVREGRLKVLVESFRDWGRDCWCESGQDNTCKKRYGWQLGELPEGYDHKYIYSHLGYNLKPLDVQAAIGREQLTRLDGFVAARRRNWEILRTGLAPLEEHLEFQLPTHATAWTSQGFRWGPDAPQLPPGSTECDPCAPSWFGFSLRVRPGGRVRRADLVRALDEARIGHRMFFGGNLVRQPAFVQLRKDRPDAFRVVGDLAGADRIMTECLFVGVFPGLSRPMLEHMIDVITRCVSARAEGRAG